MPNTPAPSKGFRIARRGGVRERRRAHPDLFRFREFKNSLDMLKRLFWILTAITRYLRTIRAYASRTFEDHHAKPKAPTMSAPKTSPSFLDFPPEIRNRIYTFATYPISGERCLVAPCMALVRTCKQICHEYRPICMKADVTIDWRDVPRYLLKYYTSHDGTSAHTDLAPARMTIITNASLRGNKPVEIDLLPILKFRLANTNFECAFIRSGDEESKGCACVQNVPEITRDDLNTLLAADRTTLQKLLAHQNESWVEDITQSRIHKLIASHIGTNCCPNLRFYIGPGEEQSVSPEFANIAKDKGAALLAEDSGPRQVTASHWTLTFSRNFDDYMDRIKLRTAFTDNQYGFVPEFKWSPVKAMRKEGIKSIAAAYGHGPEENSDSGGPVG
ncbi:uncharacterized protein M421DRAFT_417942 [Didymella exigua CBS 183.55]|uniref:F-box domain-containing protein n=1 Tax=Didymella exigua CBS 183.55 TaxID=1150837 RepID=A0A6A5RYB9_9PLEO|nr:uncharacterized protein M421DRAFT_417942 [Didymella exigua CBS 183.55]KAF1931296.1 hypothetical protein M421DRAFT_417942 [Didymella exigua CBS 183.55]